MTVIEDLSLSLQARLPLSEVDGAEIYAESRHRLEIQSKDQSVDAWQESAETGLALRLEKQGRLGFAYTTGQSPEDLERIVAAAYNSLKTVEPKHPQCLPRFETGATGPSLEQFDESLAARSASEKIAKALLVEKVACDYDERIYQTRMATYNETDLSVHFWNSDGGARSFRRTVCQAYLMAMARDDSGQEADWNIGFSPFFDGLDCEVIATQAAADAVGRLQADSLQTGRYPAVLDKSVVTAFLGILSPSFLGDAVQKKKSHLAGKLGEQVYSPQVNLIDDGLYAGGLETAPYDSEGIISQSTSLVSEGILQVYLYDTVSAKIDSRASTGNSVRSGFKEAPRAGIRNFYLAPSDVEAEALYDGIEDGVAIHDVIGMHTANPITGDFSVGASGYRIRHGKKADSVRGFAISGNLHHIFAQVEAVGSDLQFYGPVGAPSVRIKEIAVGGT